MGADLSAVSCGVIYEPRIIVGRRGVEEKGEMGGMRWWSRFSISELWKRKQQNDAELRERWWFWNTEVLGNKKYGTFPCKSRVLRKQTLAVVDCDYIFMNVFFHYWFYQSWICITDNSNSKQHLYYKIKFLSLASTIFSYSSCFPSKWRYTLTQNQHVLGPSHNGGNIYVRLLKQFLLNKRE